MRRWKESGFLWNAGGVRRGETALFKRGKFRIGLFLWVEMKVERVMGIEPTYGAEMALDRLIGIKRPSYAKISFTTLPWTSVRRKSRPA